ncbi:MAG: AGE family epimerase/isomerase [Opitutus sp.]
MAGIDEKHGGLLLHADCDGGPPRGTSGASSYEAAVRANWASKLWWVHPEALYATLLACRMSGGDSLHAWFDRVREYAFRIFPHPDPAVGEWIQIRDREGKPIERVVALPVKDPYHIARNLIQIIELLVRC